VTADDRLRRHSAHSLHLRFSRAGIHRRAKCHTIATGPALGCCRAYASSSWRTSRAAGLRGGSGGTLGLRRCRLRVLLADDTQRPESQLQLNPGLLAGCPPSVLPHLHGRPRDPDGGSETVLGQPGPDASPADRRGGGSRPARSLRSLAAQGHRRDVGSGVPWPPSAGRIVQDGVPGDLVAAHRVAAAGGASAHGSTPGSLSCPAASTSRHSR